MGVSTRNWAGNQRCVPTAVHQPGSTDEVAAIVRQAAEAGRRVKAIGGGHSFTDAAMTDGDLISLDAMRRVLRGRRHRRDRASGHPAPRPQRAARSTRPGDAQPRRHRPPVDRRRHVDRDARHRRRIGQPGDDDRRCRTRHRRRLGACGRTRRTIPNCCAWRGSASARWASSPRSPCGACRRSTCMRARRSNRSPT